MNSSVTEEINKHYEMCRESIRELTQDPQDKNKLDQGKYQAGVIQDFIPALSSCLKFGGQTDYWDSRTFDPLYDFGVFQLNGLYSEAPGVSGFLNIHAMAFSLLCYLEHYKREMIGGDLACICDTSNLIFYRLALKELAELGSMNNKPFGKYDRGSWMLVENAKVRYLDAFWRHQLDDLSAIDPTTGKLHVVAMLWNLLALITFNLKDESNDKVLRAVD